MKKPPGFQPPSSDMLPKLSWTFTKPILLNLGLCCSLSLDVFTHSDNSERNSLKKKNPRKIIFLFLKRLCSFLYSFLPFSELQLLQLFSIQLQLHLFNLLHKPFQYCCRPLLGLPLLHHLRDESLNEACHLDVE